MDVEGKTVYLWHVFLIKPFAALSILICLTTIFSLFSLERRRPHHSTDRFLIGFMGLLSVYQGMRILESAGLVTLASNTRRDDAIELIVTVFYLLAALLLRLSSVNRLDVESALRLASAAPPRMSRPEAVIEAPWQAHSVEKLRGVLPKVSDGGFKLYAYLFLYADSLTGRIASSGDDLITRLGKPAEEIHRYLRELERASAITVLRSGDNLTIDLSGRPGAAAPSAELPPALSAIRS